MGQRIFHQLQERVGDNHTYQRVLLCLFSTLILIAGSTIFGTPYLFHIEGYRCDSSIEDCHAHVCALTEDEKRNFRPLSTSMLEQFEKDYRCEGQEELLMSKTTIYLGGLIATVGGSALAGVYTHRTMLLICLGLNMVGLCVTLLSPYLWMVTVGYLTHSIGSASIFSISSSYISEVVSQSTRVSYVMILFFAYAFSAPLVAVVFWVALPWKLTLVLYLFVPCLICLMVSRCYLEETPMDLISRYSAAYSLQRLQRVAKINQVDTDITQNELTEIKECFGTQAITKTNTPSKVSLLSLFKLPSIRCQLLIGLVSRFMLGFNFNAPQLVISDFAYDIYTNGFVMGTAELISAVICALVIKKLSRRKGLIYSAVSSSLIAFPIALFYTCQGSEDGQCSKNEKFIQTTGIFVVRLIVSFAFNLAAVWSSEVFPSQIRVVATQFVMFPSKLAIMVIPTVQFICQTLDISIIVVFFLLSVLLAIFSFGVKETLGVPPPEVVPEWQNKLQKSSDCSLDETVK